MKELKGLEDSVKEIEQLCSEYEDMKLLIEMSEEEPDEETSKEIEEELEEFETTFEEPSDQHTSDRSVRQRQCHRDASCRRRRYGVLRLGGYAVSYVYKMGREKKATMWKNWIIWREM